MASCSRFPCCVLLALSRNTNENPSTDKLSRAIMYCLCKYVTSKNLTSSFPDGLKMGALIIQQFSQKRCGQG